MVNDILKAINLMDYEYKKDDKILVRNETLQTLAKEIRDLRARTESLSAKATKLKIQVNNLTSKLIKSTTYPELDIKG